MRRAHASSARRHLVMTVVAALVSGLTVATLAAAAPAAAAASTEWGRPNSAGDFGVHGRGNGHGHGMSQYGAQGAAIAGRSTRQILAFYYPHTTLTTLAASVIRVRLSNAGPYTTVIAGTNGLSVTRYGRLPSTGYSYFRLTPYGTGLAVAGKLTSSGSWKFFAKNLPSLANFYGFGNGQVRLLLADRTITRYHGTVGAQRSGAGEITVNRVPLDYYAQAVVPREMPASWRPAAVGAQAVAARSYGRNAVESSVGDPYDICDTTMCQVYGGMAHYDRTGHLLWVDDPAAIAGNKRMVLTYGGHTIFAQFSASNGGASVAGGTPYLVGKVDPYDAAASGDPYLAWSHSVSGSTIAKIYGLHTVTAIHVTSRDGHGMWGGRVLTARVYGTTSSGSSTHVDTTGNALASAMGALTSFFHFV